MGNQPKQKFRAGSVSATIWENEVKVKGETKTFFTTGIERSYKDKDDKWQSTNTMRVNDLPKVLLVINQAYKFLVMDNKKEEEIKEKEL